LKEYLKLHIRVGIDPERFPKNSIRRAEKNKPIAIQPEKFGEPTIKGARVLSANEQLLEIMNGSESFGRFISQADSVTKHLPLRHQIESQLGYTSQKQSSLFFFFF
jgi:hypothetical protein